MKKLILKTTAITLASIIGASLLVFGIFALFFPAPLARLFEGTGGYSASIHFYERQYKKTGDIEDLAEFVVKIDLEKDSDLAEEYLYEIINHKDFLAYCTEQDHLSLSNISTKEYFNGSYASVLVKNGKFDSALDFAREFVNANGYTAYNPYSVVIMNNGDNLNLEQLRIFEGDIEDCKRKYVDNEYVYRDSQIVEQLIKNLT